MVDLVGIGNCIRLKLVKPVGNMAAKCEKMLSQSPKFQIPTLLQVLGIPNKSKFCPNKLAEIPKIGKIPTIY